MKIILANFEHNISFFSTFKAHMGGILASDYTPSRTGYFYASLILKRNNNVPLPTGLSSVISSNAVEFTFKVIGVVFALFYLIWFIRPLLSVNLYLILILVIILMAIITLCLILVLWWEGASNFMTFFERIPYLKKIIPKIQEIQIESMKLKPIIWKILILSMIIWVLKGLTWLFFFYSLGIDKINLIECMLLQPLVTAFSFIPLFPSGLGLQEVGIVFILGIFDISPQFAIAFDILLRSNMIFNLIGLFFVLDIIKSPLLEKS
jgi:uncharacterized protein (TIRG00374 family)